jgi:uncharacterized membrane protein YfhO
MGCINPELFDQGYALLADETLSLTKFSEKEISGSVTALSDGLLYTSIPNDGHWTARVDGVEKKMLYISEAMAALPLSEGTHLIEFSYRNKYFSAGIIISLAFLCLYAGLILLDMRKQKNQQALSTKKRG